MLKFLNRSLSTYNEWKYDLVVVGGGIIGTASAREMQIRHPNIKVAVVEKEDGLGKHQSSLNSGILHVGITNEPGSSNAKLCADGLVLLQKYMEEKNIPNKKIGKLIVATNSFEVKRLLFLWERAQKNKSLNLELIDANQIKEREPYCKGLKAIWSPETGIVDFGLVTQYFGKDIKDACGDVHLNFKVDKFAYSPSDPDYPVHVMTKDNRIIATKYVLTCGGLYADELAKMTGCTRDPKIIPIRGEYLKLDIMKKHMVTTNINPVPDLLAPMIGLHFTPRMDGSVWVGPNAIFALKREGYSWGQISLFDTVDSILYPGFIKLSKKYMRFEINEISRSIFKSLQVKQLQKYIPKLKVSDLTRGPAAVSAHAVDEHGNFVDKLLLDRAHADNVIAKRVIHCRNIISAGGTYSMSIAKAIADEISKEFKLESVC